MFDLLLVDDHKIMRDGLRAILRGSTEFRVVGEAATGPDAIRLCCERHVDIAVMDIQIPELDGIEATAEILRHRSDTKVVVLSMYDDDESVLRAIRGGARGFVLKRASDSDLLDALRTVARGGFYLSPQVSGILVGRIQRGALAAERVPSLLDILSPREKQVMRMVAEGRSSKEIATLLRLELQTIRSYRKTLMKKLGVNNVAALTQLALANGLVRQGAMAASASAN
jgi:DNA-binding NarL/FixJ family response regulator